MQANVQAESRTVAGRERYFLLRSSPFGGYNHPGWHESREVAMRACRYVMRVPRADCATDVDVRPTYLAGGSAALAEGTQTCLSAHRTDGNWSDRVGRC